jgi:ribonuclease III
VSSLPHAFQDERLLDLALTHASTGASEDNERMEFLGDAVLDLIVAEELYRLTPPLDEGAMTELKAWVVSRKVLAGVARDLGLEERARVGAGMRDRALTSSMLANLYEAALGAVYLDAGLDAARSFARATLAGPLERVQVLKSAPNEKQLLQRHSQVQTGEPPDYVVLRDRGHAHAKAFLVAAEVGGRRFPSAWGRTLKEAERWAAHEALLVIQSDEAQKASAPAAKEPAP